MDLLKTLFFKKRSGSKYRKDTLAKIRKNLAEYNSKKISITECVSKIGPLTVELIFIHSSGIKKNKSVYNSILNMITNYYIMLYMDMYTGFYAVNRKHTFELVSSLVEEVLKETAKKQVEFKSINPDAAIHLTHDFTKQMVEVYYRAGIEGCHRYIASSVYSAVLSQNKNLSIKRDRVEHIIREIQAEKFLIRNYEDEVFSLENTG